LVDNTGVRLDEAELYWLIAVFSYVRPLVG
jgi:hypothetical protein